METPGATLAGSTCTRTFSRWRLRNVNESRRFVGRKWTSRSMLTGRSRRATAPSPQPPRHPASAPTISSTRTLRTRPMPLRCDETIEVIVQRYYGQPGPPLVYGRPLLSRDFTVPTWARLGHDRR